jgi:O-antigen/teichoic acid export membrane protein
LTEDAKIDAPMAAREVRRRFLLFFFPGVLQLVLAFVTLPITTLVLGPADFAAFSLVISFSALAMSLSQMGSVFVLSQRFRGASEQERFSLVSTMTALVLTSSLVLAALFVIAFIFLRNTWSISAGISLTMVLLAAVESIGSSLYTLALGISKLGVAPGHYSLIAMLKNLTAVGATLASLFLFDLKGVSLFIGHAAGGVVALVGSLAMLSRFLRPRIDWDMLKDALYLGGWSTVSFLALQARQTIERAVLSRYVGLHDLGLFVHAQQYQSIATLGAQPIQSAVTPVLLDEAKDKNSKFTRTARTSNVLFVGVTVFGVAAALFARSVIGVLTHDKFNAAGPYVALLIGVVLVQLSGRPQLARLLSNGRGRYISLCNVIAAVGAVVVLFALVGHIGLLAAVCASYTQFLLFRLATGFDPYSTARLPFQDQWVIFGLAVIAGTVAGVEYFEPDLLMRAALFVAFLAVVAIFARSTIRDVILQIREHLGFRGHVVNSARLDPPLPAHNPLDVTGARP